MPTNCRRYRTVGVQVAAVAVGMSIMEGVTIALFIKIKQWLGAWLQMINVFFLLTKRKIHHISPKQLKINIGARKLHMHGEVIKNSLQ